MKQTLTDALTTLRRPLICDGAMGTQLMVAGLPSGACGEMWNVRRPDAVEAVHRRYREAGCDLLITNTFGGTTFALDRHGHAADHDAINRAGVEVARRAAGDSAVWVLGDVGPFGDFLEPMGDMTTDRLHDIFARQCQVLADAGADAIIVETMQDVAEMQVAVRAAVKTGLPVIATYAFGTSGADNSFRTMMGHTVESCMKTALDAGATVVGVNCGSGLSLDDYLRLARQVRQAAGDAPTIVQPNAGAPRQVEGRLVYSATPQQMAEVAGALAELGVRIIGGCCGTTPEHLGAMSAALRNK